MQVNVYECSAGEDQRHFVGTFDLEDVVRANEDAVDPEEFEALRTSLETSGTGLIAGFVGTHHEYERADLFPAPAPSL